MPLDVFTNERRNAEQYLAARPVYDAREVGLGEGFGAAQQAAATTWRILRVQRNEREVIQNWLDDFEGITGYRPEAFHGLMFGDNPVITTFDYAALQKAWETESTSRAGFALAAPPTRDHARAAAVEMERGFLETQERLADRPGGFARGAGETLGTLGAFAVDPLNIAAFAFGTPWSAGALYFALREGAIVGATQLGISGLQYPLSREIDPAYGVGDVAREALLAGAGGVAFGAGLKGLAAAWARVKTGNWPRHLRDAGNQVEREAAVATDAGRAYPGAGIEGEAAFTRNYRAAEEAASAGRPIEPEADLFTTGAYRPGRVFTPDGQGVDVRYEVVEAGAVTTSDQPGYPAALQPRQRTRAISEDQITQMASRLEAERLGPSPEAATGAPVVSPDGIVESGNARIMAIRRAYQAEGEAAARYRAFLERQGFDVANLNEPVLVARRVTVLDEAGQQAFTVAANRAVSLTLSAPERALADARLVDETLLEKLVEEKALDTLDNRNFVRGFLARLPKEERGALVQKGGALSTEGVARVQAAILARAYGDPALLARILESTEPGLKGLGGAMTDAAGRWAAMREAVSRGTIPAQMNITADLLDAFRLAELARTRGAKIGDLIFGGGDLVSPTTPTTRALLGLMFRGNRAASRGAVARGLRGYAEEALKNTTEARLIGEPLTSREVLATTLARAGREDLGQAAEEALTPEAIAKALDDPATDDAALHALDDLRDAAQDSGQDLKMPVRAVDEFGNETVTMRPVREMIDEADREIAAAKEIEACAMGAEVAAAAE